MAIDLKVSSGAIAVIVLSLASAAAAQETPVKPPVEQGERIESPSPVYPPEAYLRPMVVSKPDWATPPVGVLPERALEQGVEQGRVWLSCQIFSNGRLHDCKLVSEEPVDLGFGRAAFQAARHAVLSPPVIEQVRPGGRVSFFVEFGRSPSS